MIKRIAKEVVRKTKMLKNPNPIPDIKEPLRVSPFPNAKFSSKSRPAISKIPKHAEKQVPGSTAKQNPGSTTKQKPESASQKKPGSTEEKKYVANNVNYKDLIDSFTQYRSTMPPENLYALSQEVLKAYFWKLYSHPPEERNKITNPHMEKFFRAVDEEVLTGKFPYVDAIELIYVLQRNYFEVLPKAYGEYICNSVLAGGEGLDAKTVAMSTDVLSFVENLAEKSELYTKCCSLLYKRLTEQNVLEEMEVPLLINLLKATCILSSHYPDWKTLLNHIEQRLFKVKFTPYELIEIFRMLLWLEGPSDTLVQYIVAHVITALKMSFKPSKYVLSNKLVLKLAESYVYTQGDNYACKLFQKYAGILAKVVLSKLSDQIIGNRMALSAYELLRISRYGNLPFYEVLSAASLRHAKETQSERGLFTPLYSLALAGKTKGPYPELLAKGLEKAYPNMVKDIMGFAEKAAPVKDEHKEKIARKLSKKKTYTGLYKFQKAYARDLILGKPDASQGLLCIEKYYTDAFEHLVKGLWSYTAHRWCEQKGSINFLDESVSLLNKHVDELGPLNVKISPRTLEMVQQINQFIGEEGKLALPSTASLVWNHNTYEGKVYNLVEDYVKTRGGLIISEKRGNDLATAELKNGEGKALIVNWEEDYFVDIKKYTTFVQMKRDFLEKKKQPFIEINYHDFLTFNKDGKAKLEHFIDSILTI